MSARSAAARPGIGISTAISWIASTRGGSRLDAHEHFIVGLIEEAKDMTLNEMVLRLRKDRAVSIGRSALDVWLRSRGWTFKKRPHLHWSRHGPIFQSVSGFDGSVETL